LGGTGGKQGKGRFGGRGSGRGLGRWNSTWGRMVSGGGGIWAITVKAIGNLGGEGNAELIEEVGVSSHLGRRRGLRKVGRELGGPFCPP